MSKYLVNGYGGFTGEDIAAARLVARKRLNARLSIHNIKRKMEQQQRLSGWMF